ncbi:hypothetical protein LHJ74_28055 [Streptomyces sp. N2-109]|uniref:Integral membrane protein n=1 Tax=Streptomyces gossypii TaxID=2883101 RepID=A0ABT2K0L2_9ACTN|nr:hypothetical protein [Streptomyces gossypii]MCT2592981.1 hypothetical protein [Streptomyces gossypii]MCT2593714.1 hypothetical protein [Streptomyces gossypii]
MYGPAATPPPPLPAPRRSGRPGAKGMALRLLYASFPVWSLGLLAWVPSLRFALLRRRAADWGVLVVLVLLTAVYVTLLITVEEDPKGEGMASFWAGVYVVFFIIGAAVHAILADRFLREPGMRGFMAAAPGGPVPGGHLPGGPPPGALGETQVLSYGYPPTAYGTGAPSYGYPQSPAPSYGYPQPQPQPQPQAQAPAPQPPAAPASPAPHASTRMRQVASELDELDELLRKRGDPR